MKQIQFSAVGHLSDVVVSDNECSFSLHPVKPYATSIQYSADEEIPVIILVEQSARSIDEKCCVVIPAKTRFLYKAKADISENTEARVFVDVAEALRSDGAPMVVDTILKI